MIYTVRRKVIIAGVEYLAGSTITSEQIGRQRTELALLSVGTIAKAKVQAETPASNQEQASTVVEAPKNKGGRPKARA